MAEAGQVKTEQTLDREAEARRQLALAQIRQYPDPALRMQSRDVEQFDRDLERLVERLTALMRDANGLGLAAPQIGVVRRVFVFQPDEGEPTALVNPRIISRSDESKTDNEGCLSLQGVVIPVERNVAITVEARDVKGGEVRLELTELAARIAQHELDHLDGILILDRTTPEARREALAIPRPQPILAAIP